MDLSQKVAFVIGRVSGIGPALCGDLDRRGSAVVVVDIDADG
jgi:NAD(P)-dependent dehydrogenase (short-subunit alcohol dehydrogenase family)